MAHSGPRNPGGIHFVRRAYKMDVLDVIRTDIVLGAKSIAIVCNETHDCADAATGRPTIQKQVAQLQGEYPDAKIYYIPIETPDPEDKGWSKGLNAGAMHLLDHEDVTEEDSIFNVSNEVELDQEQLQAMHRRLHADSNCFYIGAKLVHEFAIGPGFEAPRNTAAMMKPTILRRYRDYPDFYEDTVDPDSKMPDITPGRKFTLDGDKGFPFPRICDYFGGQEEPHFVVAVQRQESVLTSVFASDVVFPIAVRPALCSPKVSAAKGHMEAMAFAWTLAQCPDVRALFYQYDRQRGGDTGFALARMPAKYPEQLLKREMLLWRCIMADPSLRPYIQACFMHAASYLAARQMALSTSSKALPSRSTTDFTIRHYSQPVASVLLLEDKKKPPTPPPAGSPEMPPPPLPSTTTVAPTFHMTTGALPSPDLRPTEGNTPPEIEPV